MRRFLLLLLAFVLPLQMSWAAVHFCDESAHAISAEQVADAVADLANQADDASQANGDPAKPDALADACCSAAHGCHGLHSVMGPSGGLSLSPPAAHAMAAAPPALPKRDALSRIDRPQWLVA